MTVPNTVRAARQHLAARFFPVLHYPNPEAAEWLSVRSGAWWLLLLTPALHLFSSNFLFTGFRRIAPEGAWQEGMGAIIGAQLLVFLLGGRGARAGALLASALVWAFVAGVTGAAAPHVLLPLRGLERLRMEIALTTGIGVYASLATDCAVAAVFLCKQLYTDWLYREGAEAKAGADKEARADKEAGGPSATPESSTPWGD